MKTESLIKAAGMFTAAYAVSRLKQSKNSFVKDTAHEIQKSDYLRIVSSHIQTKK